MDGTKYRFVNDLKLLIIISAQTIMSIGMKAEDISLHMIAMATGFIAILLLILLMTGEDKWKMERVYML